MFTLKKINKGLYLTILVTSMVFHAGAQSALSVLTAESGNRSTEQATCWGFGAVSYTNTASQIITGSWSMRSNSPTTLDINACWIKSPWIKVTGNSVTLKIKFEAANAATIRRVVASYVPYDANNAYKEGSAVRFDSTTYTYSASTPLPTTAQNLSFSIPSSIKNNNQVYKIMLSFVGTGGSTRYDIDDVNIPGTYWSNPSNSCFPQALIQDADGDGVADADDAYPNDASRAYNNYYPSSTSYGTLMFEDLWPAMGDYDFNDLVLGYRINKVTNASNKLVEIKATYIIKAVGASFVNGFAVQLDGISPSLVTGVSGTKTGNTSWLSVASNGVENNQTYANIIVYDNVNHFLINTGTIGTNVTYGATYVTPDTANVTISFSTGANAVAANSVQLNPYLIVNQIREKEVHLANYLPTSKASSSYFGTEDDNTSAQAGVYYKSKTNLPWGLDIPQSVPYLREKVDFLKGYLNFANWAQSNGTSNTNWYLDLPANRDVNYLY